MEHIDTLIHATWVIPVEPENTVYENYAVAVHEGKILAVLPGNEAVAKYSSHITHRLAGHALIPGLINAHTHAAMSLLRGYADDLPLMKWLNERIWPAEKAWIGPEFVKDGSRLAIAEMLMNGVTCFNDMYFYPDVTGKVVRETGIRANLGLILIDFASAWAENAEAYLHKAEMVYEEFKDDPLIRTALAPHAPYSVSDEPLEKAARLAKKLDLRIHMHVHETADEIHNAQAQDGYRPIARLDLLELLTERLQAVHVTQITDEEINLLANRGVHVIHCPESNMKLASGLCPVHKLMQAGVNVALGTDGAASNNDLDMLGEMRSAALLAKSVSNNPAAVSAAQALRMATLNGAKALGIDDITGSLEAGKAADITAVNLNTLSTQPLYNALSQLVYAGSREQVTDVWVAGRHLLKSRSLTSIDLHELQAAIHLWNGKIVRSTKDADNV